MADGPAGGATILDRRKAGTGTATETADHGSKNPNIKNPDISKKTFVFSDFSQIFDFQLFFTTFLEYGVECSKNSENSHFSALWRGGGFFVSLSLVRP